MKRIVISVWDYEQRLWVRHLAIDGCYTLIAVEDGQLLVYLRPDIADEKAKQN